MSVKIGEICIICQGAISFKKYGEFRCVNFRNGKGKCKGFYGQINKDTHWVKVHCSQGIIGFCLKLNEITHSDLNTPNEKIISCAVGKWDLSQMTYSDFELRIKRILLLE